MTANKILININRQTVQNPKYFVYKRERYQVNFDLLKQNCTYFYQNQDEYLFEDVINIFEKDDEEFELDKVSIISFIKICQNESTEISLDSVIDLQYLSYKYEYPDLKKRTNELITEYPQVLIFKRLLMKKKSIDKCTKNEEEFFDTSKEEEYISNHLNDFIKRDEILELKMPVIFRIFEKYLNDEESDTKVNKKDMIDFLFRCLDKYGSEASILFNKIDFAEEQINVVHRLNYQYKGRFNFIFLNSTLANTTLQLVEDSDRQKKEHSELFDEMKNQFKDQSDELKRLQDDVEQRMLNIEKHYKQICIKQKSMIENSVILKFHEIIIKLMGDDNFYRLDTESQIFVVDEIINKDKYHNNYEKENKLESMAQKILFFNQLFQNSSIEELNKNSLELVKFILENAKVLKLSNDICVNLFQKNLLEKTLLVVFNSFDQFEISIEHPTNSYEEISKIVNDAISQNENTSQQIQISDVNTQNDTFEMKYEITQTNMTQIEFNSSKGCSSLTKYVIPPSVTTIEPNSFKNYSSLREITIPTSVTKICESSFEGCSSLTKIVIPPSISTIEPNSFKSCSSLSEITIPISVKKICESSFEGCSLLSKIVIPTSVLEIESNSFKNCSSLDEITIPSSITKICESSFEYCSSLTKIVIPTSVTTIESNSFKNCSSLNEITIPSSVTKIGESSFEGCSSLTQIVIPSSVNNLGQDSFRGCSSLSRITFPENIENIGKTCFYGCNPKVEIFGKIIPKNAFHECSTLQEIIISSNTTIIEEDSFRGCSSLTKVTIPDSVTIIKNNAFQGCSKLPEIIIPTSVTSIGDSSFSSCSSLTQIIIPTSVTSIGDSAFSSCSSLKHIVIPSSVASIGDNSFSNCKEISTDFKFTGSLQTYRIPVKGIYQIKAVGASGSGGNVYNTSYKSVGGKGAQIIGKFSFDKGDTIDIVVGGQGRMINAHYKDGASGDGGGGTFIFKRIKSITDSRYQFTKNQIHYETLLVAAGGSGAEDSAYRDIDSIGFDGEASNFKSPNNFTEYSKSKADPNSSSRPGVLGITQFIEYDAKGSHYKQNDGYSYGGYGCGGSEDDDFSYGGGWCRGSKDYQTTSWSLDVKAVGTNGANNGDGRAYIHIC